MHIRIIQWNISNRSKPESISQYLKSCISAYSPTIICLQEVTKTCFPILKNTLNPSFSMFSLDLRPKGKREGSNRSLGIAIFGFLASSGSVALVDRSVFPERTLDITCRSNNYSLRVMSFHSLTGVGYKKAKSSNFASIADHLEINSAIDFLCFDANEPKVDSLYPERKEFYNNGDKGEKASLILGAKAVHHLHDAYATYLQSKGMIEDRNPLVISYMTKHIPRRYDYIFASSQWDPMNVEYKYEEAIAATSDHAIVISDFRKT